jgi:hypothetical protein
MNIFRKTFLVIFIAAMIPFLFCQQKPAEKSWKPLADWGHWRLGQKADPEFLKKNHMTITFGSGAPNFESVTRSEFDQKIQEAKEFNQKYHDQGYIVLRYLSTSLNGETATNKDIPEKDQIDMLKFYQERWDNYADIIGPKPQADPTTWITVRPDGSFPFYRYAPYGKETTGGFETWGCPDNPYYVRMMIGKMRSQAQTGIDGSYVDWTHISGGTCYCDYTRQNFIKYLQENLPAEIGKAKYGTSDYQSIKLPEKRGDKFWMEWVTFRGHVVAEFHKKLRTAAREVNPNFMISGNVFGGFGYGPIAYDAAGNMEMLGRDGYDDFIYSEMQEFLDSAPRKDENGTKITNSPALKFLTAASHGKPVIVYATEITPPIFPDPTDKCLSAMAQINIAEAVANHTIFREKRLTPQGATDTYAFLAANEENLVGAQLNSNVAVLSSLNQYLADELSFVFSASRILADKGISHVMIVEDDLLNGNLNQYDLIFIPYLPLLSQEKQEALKTYVENGGQLLVLGASGVKNEYNLPSQRRVFAEMLGGSYYPGIAVTRTVGQGSISYLPLQIPKDRFLIPAKDKSEVTTFGPSMAEVFPDIPEGYTRNRIDPRLRKHLENASNKIIELLKNNVNRLKSPAPYVEITTMQNVDKNLMIMNLVNYNVTIDGTITPAENVSVQLVLPSDKKIKTVRYSGNLAPMEPVEFTTEQKAGRQLISFNIPIVEVYGLAICEFE